MKLHLLPRFIRQWPAWQRIDNSAPARALVCQHCHEHHAEDYLCPELLYAHGLPSRAASRYIQNRAG